MKALLPRLAPIGILVLAAGGTVSTASAQRVTAIAIETPGNTEMAGVTVCLGTTQDRDRDGTQTTNFEGRALFSDAPNEPLVVTAHKDGFSGVERSIPASSYDRTPILPLVPGSGGPRCPSSAGTGGGSDVGTSIGSIGGKGVFRPIDRRRAPAPRVARAPRITSFTIGWSPQGDASVPAGRSVPLLVRHEGADPIKWRVSERSNFAGARWNSWQGPGFLSYTFGGEPGTRRLYVQLGSGNPRRPIASNVMDDEVEVQSAPVRCVVELVYRDSGSRSSRVIEKGNDRVFQYAQNVARITHRGARSPEYSDGSLFYELESILPGFLPMPNVWLNENQGEDMEWHERLKRLSCRDFAP